MLTDRKHHVIWGTIGLFSAALGFVIIGIVRSEYIADNIYRDFMFMLVIGVIGGALGIAQE